MLPTFPDIISLIFLAIPLPFLDINDKHLAFKVNLFIDLKMTQVDGAIIFNLRLTKSSHLLTGEGLGERRNLPSPVSPDRKGANPMKWFVLAKVLS